MRGNDDTELTQDERAAFDSLPRETEPGRLLEERTVQALRHRGLILPGGWKRPSRRAPVWAVGLAASGALFVSGAAAGQWLASRAVAGSVLAAQQQTAMQTAALVQRTGSAYVTALSSLVQLADSSSDPAVGQGKEAALTALYAATHELALLAPEDPLTVFLRQELGRLRGSEAGAGESEPRLQRLVWF